MSNSLPQPIASFFSAKNSGDTATLDRCLSPSVLIKDVGENTEVTGSENAKSWIQGIHKKYALFTDILDFRDDGDAITVNTMVSGSFPGSPLPFTYRFSLADGKLTNIVITQSK